MTTLAISHRGIGKKIKALSLPSIPWKLLYAAVSISITGMLVWYVVSINQLTKGAYTIKDYNRQIAQLIEEGTELETSFAKTGFLGNIQTQVREFGFEKTSVVTYVKILDQSLADAGTRMVK